RRYRLMVDLVVSEDALTSPHGAEVRYLLSLLTEGECRELGISMRQFSLLKAMHSLQGRLRRDGEEDWVRRELLRLERAFALTVREFPTLPCLFLHGLPSVDEAFRGFCY